MQKIKQFLFKNTSAKQTAMKNTIWLFFGEIIGRILKLAIVVFATRQLGVEGWGVFSYALAFVSLFYVLSDIGINTFITREMSRDSEDKYHYLSSTTIIKLVLMFTFFIVSLLLAPHFQKIRLGLTMIATLSLLNLSDGIKEFMLSINRSRQKMEVEGFSKIIMNSIITVLGIILLIKKATPLSLAIAYATGSIISSFFVFLSIKSEFKNIRWNISKKDLRTIYDFSWPIIIISLFSFIFNIDTIMLGQIKSATDVGLYAASQRLVQFLGIVPGFIAISVFPMLSKNNEDIKKMGYILEKVMTLFILIGLPLTVGGLLFSQKIIVLIFGPAYSAGGPVLGVLMISILATFSNLILTNIIFSKNLQKIFISATSFGVVVNIILNFWLITKYGAIGAGISTMTTQFLITAINWNKLKKIIPFEVLSKLGKIITATVIMTILIVILNTLGMNFILITLIGVVIYALTLHLLKEPSFKEIFELATGN